MTAYIQFDPRRAVAAARTLAADPERLPEVFTIIESLSGTTLERITRRFATTDAGRRLLADRPDIVPLLADRAALARLPEGSLGRAYLDFVESEGISAEGIRAAAAEGWRGEAALPAPLDWVHARMRDTHDLWHAAVGYRGDVLGESALLAFLLAQGRNPAVGLILGIALFKLRRWPGARGVILDGFRRGRRAAWLPAQEWESLLALPVDEVRRRLSLEAPPRYAPVRPADIKAARAAA
jgi:ubiquinone biosynthesis protein COQ4